MGNLLDDIVSRVVCDTDHKSCKFRIGCRPGQLVYLSQQEIESMQQDFMADNAGWSLFGLFYGQTLISRFTLKKLMILIFIGSKQCRTR